MIFSKMYEKAEIEWYKEHTDDTEMPWEFFKEFRRETLENKKKKVLKYLKEKNEQI